MNQEPKYQLMKFIDNELEVTVSTKEETIWMILDQLSILFGRDKSVISRHIKKIFDEQELDELSTIAKNATVEIEGGRGTAASRLSDFGGFATKISTDGYIELYKAGEVCYQIK